MNLTESDRTRDWARLLLWTPLVVGGLLTALFATRAYRLRRALRRSWSSVAGADVQDELRLAIVGNDKQTIAAVFGPPRSAVHRGVAETGASRAQFLAADTWYYPFDPADRRAVVIEFEGGVARRAEFIQAPRPREQPSG